jgi:hypothetical protein
MLIRFGQYVLRQFLAVGQLSIALGDGPMHHITAGTAGPQAAIRLTHRRVLRRLMLHPDLAFSESYMDGDLQIESGDIDDLMALLVANREHWQNHWLARLVLALDTRLVRFSGLNFPGRAKRNVAHHYDLKDSLFDNFLDPWRQYSCAYFRSPDEPLADAQITKLSRIAAKLRLQPHDHVLDIGCGWGGLAFALTTVEPEAKVTGITCRKTSLRLPAMLSAQHHKPTGSVLRCATIGNKSAALTRLYQLACSNMSAQNIMTAILPALPDYSQQTGWRLSTRLRSAKDPAGATGGSTNIFSPAAICRRLNRCPPPPGKA